jgi:hypothetical protein
MKRKAAIICPIKDEYTFIGKFFEYYQQHFDRQDIYILNFGSSPEYLDNIIGDNARVIHTDANILDAIELFNAMRSAQRELYKEYTYVLPLDVDEIIVYNKEGGLRKYLEETETDLVSCVGQEVIHLGFLQEPLDYSKKWMDQIKYWYPNHNHYGKTLISKNDLPWSSGFHTYDGEDIPIRIKNTDPNLFLVHFHKHDYTSTIKRHKDWSEMEWSENTIKGNHNHHYRQKSNKKVQDWYYAPMFDGIYEIPESIKKSINF